MKGVKGREPERNQGKRDRSDDMPDGGYVGPESFEVSFTDSRYRQLVSRNESNPDFISSSEMDSVDFFVDCGGIVLF